MHCVLPADETRFTNDHYLMRIFKIWRQNRPGWTKESRSIAFGLGCDEPDKESRGSWGCRSHTYLNSLNVPLAEEESW